MRRPEVRIARGSPSADEAAAVEAAIVHLWRDAGARAARAAKGDAWVRSARADPGLDGVSRGPEAWRRAARARREP